MTERRVKKEPDLTETAATHEEQQSLAGVDNKVYDDDVDEHCLIVSQTDNQTTTFDNHNELIGKTDAKSMASESPEPNSQPPQDPVVNIETEQQIIVTNPPKSDYCLNLYTI